MGQGPSTSTLTGATVSESAEIRGRPTDPVHWHDRGCASGVSTPSARSPMDCRRTTDVLWFFIEAVARVAAKMPFAGCECQGLRPSQLEPFVNISTAHMLESTEVSAVPVEVVEVKTSVEEPPFPVQATAPFAQCKSSSLFVVATWASRATAARGQLPLAISKKHHTLFVEVSSFLTTAARSH